MTEHPRYPVLHEQLHRPPSTCSGTFRLLSPRLACYPPPPLYAQDGAPDLDLVEDVETLFLVSLVPVVNVFRSSPSYKLTIY